MEKTAQAKPLLYETAVGAAAARIRKYRIPLTSSFVFAFLAYMFAFTNKLINHEEAGQLFDKGATTTSGRLLTRKGNRLLPRPRLTIIWVSPSVCRPLEYSGKKP